LGKYGHLIEHGHDALAWHAVRVRARARARARARVRG